MPGLAAREVAVGALGTVYALSASGDDVADALAPLIAQSWTWPPRCRCWPGTCSRRSACRRWRPSSARPTPGAMPLIMAGYLFALAYVAAFITYRLALAFGAG